MLSIGENEITHYHEEGFVVSQNYLSDDIMNKISKCYDDFVTTYPSLTLEEMASPHIYGGVNMKHQINHTLSNAFLDVCNKLEEYDIPEIKNKGVKKKNY